MPRFFYSLKRSLFFDDSSQTGTFVVLVVNQAGFITGVVFSLKAYSLLDQLFSEFTGILGIGLIDSAMAYIQTGQKEAHTV